MDGWNGVCIRWSVSVPESPVPSTRLRGRMITGMVLTYRNVFVLDVERVGWSDSGCHQERDPLVSCESPCYFLHEAGIEGSSERDRDRSEFFPSTYHTYPRYGGEVTHKPTRQHSDDPRWGIQY